MLICAFMAQVKKLKMKLKYKFCHENVRFLISKTWNAQFPIKKFLSLIS